MSTPTKEQIQALVPEQQKDIAVLLLGRMEKRRRLLKQARRSQILFFFQGVVLFLVVDAALNSGYSWRIIFCTAGLAALILSEIIHANRRIDALLELYEEDGDKKDTA